MLHLEINYFFVAIGMALVNCSVVNRTLNKTVLPWSILSAGESGITIQQFYDEKIVCKVQELNEMDLESAFLGKSKESLDKIELSLSLDSAIHLFGPFLRYYTCDRPQQLPPMRNAFTVLMSSQRQLSLPGLPAPVTVRTIKDKLYNDCLELLKEENALFPGIEVNSSGKNFVKTVVECLWYVDGHHEKLKKQSAPIPDYFTRFTGYNLPQLSKHRKRQSTNLSSSILKSLSSSLFQNLQASFWSNTSFKCLHQHTEILAQSLASYSDYLSLQNKVMKTHAQQVPGRQLFDALSIRYIYASTGVALGKFNTLIDTADKKEDFEHLSLNDLTPAQPRA